MITTCNLTCLLIVALLFGCGNGNSNASGLRTYGALQFKLTTSKPIYRPSEQVPLSFSITNTGKSNISFSSVQIYEITVKNANQVIWFFPQGGIPEETTVVFMPGMSKSFNVTWNQKDLSNNNIFPGQYIVYASLATGNLDGTAFSEQAAELNLAANPITITIQ